MVPQVTSYCCILLKQPTRFKFIKIKTLALKTSKNLSFSPSNSKSKLVRRKSG
jgi:hypothetical protein